MHKKGCQNDKKIRIFVIPPSFPSLVLALSKELTTIACQKDRNMRTLEENYDLLEILVNEERIYLNPSFTFARVCRMLGVPRARMDALLMRELGTDGASLFASLRAALPERLGRKYGLKCFFQDL